MAVPEKKRPQRKPAPRRMKKSSLKKKLPMLTIAGLLAVFVVWRTASVLLSSPEPPRPVLENVVDSGREIRKNEEKKPDMEPSRKAKAAEKPVKKEEPPAKPVPETEKKPEPAVSSQPVPQTPVPVSATAMAS